MLLILILAIISLVLTIFYSTDISFNQFHLLLVSEKVSNNKYLYLDIYDYLAPIPVYLNSFLVVFGDKNLLISQIIGFIIIFLNSLYFNSIVDKYRLVMERTFIPGLMYLLFSSTIFTGFEFSALLMASSFLLFSISAMLKVGIENSDKEKNSFISGIYFGLAFLCEQSTILFLLVGIIAAFYYSSKVFKTILPLILGFSFPVIVLLNLYLVNKNQDLFFDYFFYSYFFRSSLFNISINILTPWLSICALFLFLYFPTKLRFSFTNYVSKGHQLFVIWMVISFLLLFLTKEKSYSIIHIFVAPFSFLTSFYLLGLRKRWVAEFYTILIITFSFSFNYFDIFDNNKEFIIRKDKIESKYDGNTLLLANNLNFYSKNAHASSFSNWELEKKTFLNIGQKENLATVYLGIINDYPKYIIDPDGIFERIIKVVPLFREKYKKVDSKTYRLN